jgi:hypothetical protein
VNADSLSTRRSYCRPAATASPDPSCWRVEQTHGCRRQPSFSKLLTINSIVSSTSKTLSNQLPHMSLAIVKPSTANFELEVYRDSHRFSRHARFRRLADAEALHSLFRLRRQQRNRLKHAGGHSSDKRLDSAESKPYQDIRMNLLSFW